jgi:hypothetical protein
MQKCKLSITLQQLKMKVTKFTQTKPTPFKHEVIGNSGGIGSNINIHE